ncbi:hypothetical protein SLEP1_g43020 [Rubroshorea leprosula]|uniref:Uncharacterized protein n=1 Tax=Rubroshorea leprosula TaxID=152421 RepID=A0AAV5LBP3_9ROSI|nr:hypothetical protein SLEP1_g43020 [Rubroshorea leprosula]
MKDRLKEMNGWLDEMRESEELRVANDPAKDEKEGEELKMLCGWRKQGNVWWFISSIPAAKAIKFFSLEANVTTNSCRFIFQMSFEEVMLL